MNRDHFLWVTIGLLAGFIAGYLVHDFMAVRQPARIPPGGAAAHAALGVGQAPPGSGPAAAPSEGGASPASMAEIQRLREHVEQNPNDAEAVLLLANLNFDIRNWARARDLYQRHLELRPGDPDVLTDLGVTHRELGEHQQALALFTEAQRLKPDHWQSLYNQAVVLAFDLKDFAAADRVLAALRELQPANPSVTELAAEVARRRGAA
jgi:tetratricopeptide (TPR) repeat protein